MKIRIQSNDQPFLRDHYGLENGDVLPVVSHRRLGSNTRARGYMEWTEYKVEVINSYKESNHYGQSTIIRLTDDDCIISYLPKTKRRPLPPRF